jgi:hypothetical protein
MEKVFERAKRIILSPTEALTEVKTESTTVMTLMKEYVVFVAAIPALAQFVGYALVGLPIVGRYPFFRSLMFALFSYVLSLVGVIVVGKVVDLLAPSFNSTKNDLNAFKLAAYSMTPAFVAGIFNLIPSLGVLALLGSLYGIYVLYLGLPVLMGTAEDKRAIYTVATIVVVVIVMVIVTAIAGALAWSGGAGPGRYF